MIDRLSSRAAQMSPILRAGTALACLCALAASPTHAQGGGDVSQVPPVVVPDVVNRPVEEALAILDKVGLARGTVADRPSSGPAGMVLDQSLTPGTQVSVGTPLNIGVSGGPIYFTPDDPPPLIVPAVVGRSITDARSLVSQAGLPVGAITERAFFLPPFFQAAGTIFQQQPAAGTTLAAPVPINLVVLQPFPAWAIGLSLALLGAVLAVVIRRRSVAPAPRPQLPGKKPPTPSQPRQSDDPILLGVSAPRQANPGATFTARFVAYIKKRERAVKDRLQELDADAGRNLQTVMGLPPERGGRWVIGAPVMVRVSGERLRVKPETQSFEWNGAENMLSFLVSVPKTASHGTTQLCFEAFIEGVPIAFIPLNLTIGSQTPVGDPVTTTARPLSSAFASYASKDAPVVALLLSALKRWDPDVDVFIDCLDLTPNENWRHELERVIPTKDAFLLFWSASASKSPWVAWELQHARSTRGLEWIRPMPIDDPVTAPPPDFLQHLHFKDKYLIARQAFLRAEEQRPT